MGSDIKPTHDHLPAFVGVLTVQHPWLIDESPIHDFTSMCHPSCVHVCLTTQLSLFIKAPYCCRDLPYDLIY